MSKLKELADYIETQYGHAVGEYLRRRGRRLSDRSRLDTVRLSHHRRGPGRRRGHFGMVERGRLEKQLRKGTVGGCLATTLAT